MGRIITQIELSNFGDATKSLAFSALVDTGAAYITLPSAWRDKLGKVEQTAEVEVELGDQSARTGMLCGPLRAQIEEFRPIAAEVLFLDMQPNEDGAYQPVIGYIALEQWGAALDMLGHRLLHRRHVYLK